MRPDANWMSQQCVAPDLQGVWQPLRSLSFLQMFNPALVWLPVAGFLEMSDTVETPIVAAAVGPETDAEEEERGADSLR